MNKPTPGPDGPTGSRRSTSAGRSPADRPATRRARAQAPRRGSGGPRATAVAAAAIVLVAAAVAVPKVVGGSTNAVPVAQSTTAAAPGASGSGAGAPSGTTPAAAPSTGYALGADGQPAISTATANVSATPVPKSAAGSTSVLTVPGHDTDATGRKVNYTVELEDGVGVDGAEFAAFVRRVLTDPRGWESQDGVHFVNLSPKDVEEGARPAVHITMASPDTVDRMCAPMTTEGEVSCDNGSRVALNSVRWTTGVPYFDGDLARYRIYMINHEVGHAIGHGHEFCAGPGKDAPVMQQQTLGLQGCKPYPWPVPGKDK